MKMKSFFPALPFGPIIFFILSLCPFQNVFASQFETTLYQQFLDTYLVPGQHIGQFKINAVKYEELYKSKQDPKSLYNNLLNQLASFDPTKLSKKEDAIAFWINTYNIGAIKMILDHYPVDSIRSRKINWLKQPWKIDIITINGSQFNLNEIEHEILLGHFGEPLIHFGVVCASLSCPDLAPLAFKGDTLYAQLQKQATLFLSDPEKGLRVDKAQKKALFSMIFKFDKKTFPAGAKDALPFILPYIEQEKKAFLEGGGYDIEYLDYNWELNTTKSIR